MKKVLLIGAGADSIEHGDELDAAAFQVASVLKSRAGRRSSLMTIHFLLPWIVRMPSIMPASSH